ncbi:hypothetical protein KIM372_11750 [Bombiscardovia nodaiensis]|uniref:Uncharacterized protein n=1 Tax=Bombiscardovia nodaiensis TaxID=2932181 RepID=A0ABN6SDI4_9BIFI|nr:hypothetical protein KIM372_11750 [Bombiscardovia nodaiensis]
MPPTVGRRLVPCVGPLRKETVPSASPSLLPVTQLTQGSGISRMDQNVSRKISKRDGRASLQRVRVVPGAQHPRTVPRRAAVKVPWVGSNEQVRAVAAEAAQSTQSQVSKGVGLRLAVKCRALN